MASTNTDPITPEQATNQQPDNKAASTLSKVTTKAKQYTKFWAEHVKKGEMPWTQWYCCSAVDGNECGQENHRVHKACKKCNHQVCANCEKGRV